MKGGLLCIAVCTLAAGQNLPDVLKQGEAVFAKSCATGYCHGARGTAGGAPRLAARGFDQAFIINTVSRGVSGGGMPAFGTSLSRPELVAVVAYVASLNGISNPAVAPPGPPSGDSRTGPALTGDAARGRDLFSDALRGFGRCSTCHEVNGIGIPVAAPIANVPANAQALRNLATPQTSTANLAGESMPALVLSKGTRNVIFYDLSTPPPVLRTVEPAGVRLTDGSSWRHSAVIGGYNDAELGAVLAYLRAAVSR
jgi:mono/diheme cytochrome c family protein